MTTLESTTERLEEALRRLAVEAADLFEELLASGAEMPFDLEPSDEGPLPMYSYEPLTGLAFQKRLHLCLVDLEAGKDLIAETPEGRAAQWTRTITLDHSTAPQRERT